MDSPEYELAEKRNTEDAADQRPVPSQAEGDEDTVDEDLEIQETREQQQKTPRR